MRGSGEHTTVQHGVEATATPQHNRVTTAVERAVYVWGWLVGGLQRGREDAGMGQGCLWGHGMAAGLVQEVAGALKVESLHELLHEVTRVIGHK